MDIVENMSKRTFSGSSGTYHVQASELAAAREHAKNKVMKLSIYFLDDTVKEFCIEKKSKGRVIMDQVFQHLELIEKDYFGLQYSEIETSSNLNKPDLMRWLDPSKSIKKQLNNCHTPLYFKVKFYASDPSKLQEEFTRYQFCLQIRRDILEKKFILAPSTAILLASYTVQAELGDYQSNEHGPNYLSDIKLIPGQSEELEKKICELHKLHKNQSPAEADFNFLDHAKRMDMYGVELHKALDSTNREIQVGVTHIGLVVFQNNIRINTFSWSKILKISFKRKQFFIQLIRELSEDYDTLLGFNMESYRSAKTLWKTCVEHHTFFRLDSPKVRRKFPFFLGSRFSYSGRTEFQTVSDIRRTRTLERKFIRSPSKQLMRQGVQSPALDDKTRLSLSSVMPVRSYDNKVTSLGAKEPRKAWADDTQASEDDGGFLEHSSETPFTPSGLAGRVLSYVDEEVPSPISNEVFDTPPYSASHSPTSQVAEENQVTICLQTEDGKYGFNVKGGVHRDDPIVIARIAPNTAADKCIPRFSVGDQVMQINGVDVSHALHDHAVQLIQKSRANVDAKLTMVIKQTVPCAGLEEFEEPPFQYVPAGEVQVPPLPKNALGQSMLLLADGLGSGALIARYETLDKKHPGMSCDVAMDPNNINKNRYRDISPYDSTRVILEEGVDGDYINANYVNMKINGTNIKNNYIATQGPLQSTSEDFWQMILEQKCNLIVMLTTIIERGRAKCHKYWPDVGDTLNMMNVTVKCVAEDTDISESFLFRDFILTDQNTKSERKVVHMQYIAWPDHGVPDSPAQFLSFTQKVRDARKDQVPVVVHCSAGIGRTGVLVLMETALCLIENNEPVYPLEIVKNMREQRAMMIQNASQYRFVCESVHSAYLQATGDKKEMCPN